MAFPDLNAGGFVSLENLYLEQAKLARAMLAPLTRQGYDYDWRAFMRWCSVRRLTALPAAAETVALFVVDLLSKGRKISTVRRLVAGVTHVHRRDGHDATWLGHVLELLVGARRLQPQTLEQSTPLSIEDVREISAHLERAGTPLAIRNRAIVVTGFCSALRQASLVALDLGDVTFTRDGAVLRVRREKNDQLCRGRLLGLPEGRHSETCPVRALRDWIRVRRPGNDGPLFTHIGNLKRLGPERVCIIVQQALEAIGRPSRGYGGHSLRSGLITAAAEADVETLRLAAHSGHRSFEMVRRYYRRADLFRNNILRSIDL